ncbi:MAG: TraR/DksA C4-type zinc finger protein [Opitutaceae bacterium]|nr:TraR/DksA C4-type zinc finger protein [Opitutaceae bacterium]
MKPPTATSSPGGPSRWDWHQTALLRLRDALQRERDARHAALRTSRGEVVGDFGDAAETQQERDELVAELSLEDVELAEVEAALTRIGEGRYGICEATGEPIDPERLRAIPWTRFTQAAAARLEGKRPRPTI